MEMRLEPRGSSRKRRPMIVSEKPARPDGARRERPSAAPERRKPTYGTATRLARLMLGLIERPYGWSFQAIQDELRIGERTLLRYLAACRREVTDASGKPLIEVVRYGERRLLRLAGASRV